MDNDHDYLGADNLLNVSGICFKAPKMFNNGIWKMTPSTPSILQHHLLRLHVQLFAIFAITNFFHFFFKRVYLPRFTSEVLTGILLGPTFFEEVLKNVSKEVFPRTPDIVLSSLSKYGYTLFVFTAAVRMDPALIYRTGRKAWILGLVTLILPYVMFHSVELKSRNNATKNMGFLQFVSSFFTCITSSQFVGVTNVLMQLKITNSKLGHLALASTMISEVLRLIYATGLGYVNATFAISLQAALQNALLSITFILVILYPLRYLLLWFIRNTPEDKPMKDIYGTLVVTVVLILASVGDNVGMYYAFGPFLIGLAVPAGSPLATNLLRSLETMVLGLLMPLMATFCAMKFDLGLFIELFPKQDFLFKLTLTGFIIKLIGTYIAAMACKLTPRDAAAFTLIIHAKGVLEIGTLMSFGNLEDRFLEGTSGIFLIFLLASMITPLVKIIYDPTKQYIGHTKKSIEQASEDEELSIVVCAYKQEDAIAGIKLLEYSNPTKRSPISMYGLCLDELVSSATPVWIDHQLGQQSESNHGSRSQQLINVFKFFKSRHKKLIHVHAFTAISPIKQLHEDICWLSFEKAASLVVVPFHKKWNNRGKLASTNADIREININVLERAPCSVGILIDRPKDRGLNSIFAESNICRICVVFIGGVDDREALAYAMRMAGSEKVKLTVLHFAVPEDLEQNKWEAILDLEVLRSMKEVMARKHTNVEYVKESVQEGCDTAVILRSMQNQFDLFIVGRSHDSNPEALSGMSDWVEFPELGPVGDLLASEDITHQVSVLVVQHQIIKTSHSSVLN